MEETKRISAEIEGAKHRLDSNVHEIEARLKRAVDWQQTYRRAPLPFLGAALGTGLVVSALFGRRSSYKVRPSSLPYSEPKGPYAQAERRPVDPQISRAWEQMKGALIAYAASKATEAIGNVLPGFSDHYSGARPYPAGE